MPIEFRNRIDHPWLSLPPIRVGKIPSGLGEPHRYITIKTPEKLVRVDCESGFPYEEAILLPDFAIMAIGHCIFSSTWSRAMSERLRLIGTFATYG